MSRILLAEDEPDLVLLFRLALRQAGWPDVTTAANGAAALGLFRHAAESGAPFDLVLLDIGMPLVAGDEAAREMRRADARVRILFVTGYRPEDEPVRRALGVPDISGVLWKPVDLSELTEAVARVLAEGAPAR